MPFLKIKHTEKQMLRFKKTQGGCLCFDGGFPPLGEGGGQCLGSCGDKMCPPLALVGAGGGDGDGTHELTIRPLSLSSKADAMSNTDAARRLLKDFKRVFRGVWDPLSCVYESHSIGRFLDWGAVDCRGANLSLCDFSAPCTVTAKQLSLAKNLRFSNFGGLDMEDFNFKGKSLEGTSFVRAKGLLAKKLSQATSLRYADISLTGVSEAGLRSEWEKRVKKRRATNEAWALFRGDEDKKTLKLYEDPLPQFLFLDNRKTRFPTEQTTKWPPARRKKS